MTRTPWPADYLKLWAGYLNRYSAAQSHLSRLARHCSGIMWPDGRVSAPPSIDALHRAHDLMEQAHYALRKIADDGGAS